MDPRSNPAASIEQAASLAHAQAAEVQVRCEDLATHLDTLVVASWEQVRQTLEREWEPPQRLLRTLHQAASSLPIHLYHTLKQRLLHLATETHARSTAHLPAEAPPLNITHVEHLLAELFPPVYWSGLWSTKGEHIQAGEIAALANRLLQEGKSRVEIGLALRPYFNGSRVRAMRAARTYGHYLATQVQLVTYESTGSKVIGYTVQSLPRETARPDHARRAGTCYYRHPRSGQLGFGVMPHPPVDRGGPHEDERGIRWNCACYLVPIIATTTQATAVVTTVDWWVTASEQERKAATGVRRYNTAVEVLGHAPSWEDLVDIEGQLLPLLQIRGETPTQRAVRVLAIRKAISYSRERLRNINSGG